MSEEEQVDKAESDYVGFVSSTFGMIRTFAAEARKRRRADPPIDPMLNEIYEGSMLVVLRVMQTNAQRYNLDLEQMGMANFDPLKDEP